MVGQNWVLNVLIVLWTFDFTTTENDWFDISALMDTAIRHIKK
jgi:hypothetical protein